MNLISHACSAFCLASLVAPFCQGGRNQSIFRMPILVTIGSALPDIDGISVLFNHHVFYGDTWYSHHGAAHSLLGALLISLPVGVLLACRRGPRSAPLRSRRLGTTLTAVYLGSVLHIVEDLPCPPGPWGGLPLFWPLPAGRTGGVGWIWFSNEFLVVVLLAGALSALCFLLVRDRWLIGRTVCSMWCLLCLGISGIFVAQSRYVDPAQWETHQRNLMGDSLYSAAHAVLEPSEAIWSREIL